MGAGRLQQGLVAIEGQLDPVGDLEPGLLAGVLDRVDDLAGEPLAQQVIVEFQGEGDQGPFTVAVTGGTGAFRSAGGQARIRIRGDRTIYRLRLDLSHRKKHRH